ncbi:MAG: hypothetical protein K0R14_912 [Burkholderiales bacterium]|jgi:hypothetical protein|nr:hypothetical protein [Burkholderiales bacterium]
MKTKQNGISLGLNKSLGNNTVTKKYILNSFLFSIILLLLCMGKLHALTYGEKAQCKFTVGQELKFNWAIGEPQENKGLVVTTSLGTVKEGQYTVTYRTEPLFHGLDYTLPLKANYDDKYVSLNSLQICGWSLRRIKAADNTEYWRISGKYKGLKFTDVLAECSIHELPSPFSSFKGYTELYHQIYAIPEIDVGYNQSTCTLQ